MELLLKVNETNYFEIKNYIGLSGISVDFKSEDNINQILKYSFKEKIKTILFHVDNPLQISFIEKIVKTKKIRIIYNIQFSKENLSLKLKYKSCVKCHCPIQAIIAGRMNTNFIYIDQKDADLIVGIWSNYPEIYSQIIVSEIDNKDSLLKLAKIGIEIVEILPNAIDSIISI